MLSEIFLRLIRYVHAAWQGNPQARAFLQLQISSSVQSVTDKPQT